MTKNNAASISQSLKYVMRDAQGWHHLPPDVREHLEAIAAELAEIVSSERNSVCNWERLIHHAKSATPKLEV